MSDLKSEKGEVMINKVPKGPPTSKYVNLTLLLCLGCISMFLISSACYISGKIPASVCAILNIIALFYLYVPVHDSAHGLAHKNPRINHAIGVVGSTLLGMVFQSYRLAHFAHHRNTNNNEKDPDALLATEKLWELPFRLLLRLGYDHYFVLKEGLWKSRSRDLMQYLITIVYQLTLLVVSIAVLGVIKVAVVWLFPVLTAGLLLFYVFSWSVHYPHEGKDCSRNITAPIARLFTMNQSLHQVHHKNANIPWFYYGKVISKGDL